MVTLAGMVALSVWMQLIFPHAEGAPWTAFLPGAIVLAVGADLLRLVTQVYFAGRLGRVDDLYGALGIAAVFMAWLYLVARLIVASFAVSATRWRSEETEAAEAEAAELGLQRESRNRGKMLPGDLLTIAAVVTRGGVIQAKGDGMKRKTSGWAVGFTMFAAIMLLVAGSFQILAGLAGIFENEFYIKTSNYFLEFDVSGAGGSTCSGVSSCSSEVSGSCRAHCGAGPWA